MTEPPRPQPDDPESRPAGPGETDTTRSGMEPGDNADVPATGPASRDDEDAAPGA